MLIVVIYLAVFDKINISKTKNKQKSNNIYKRNDGNYFEQVKQDNITKTKINV